MTEFEGSLKVSLQRYLSVPVFAGTPIDGLTDEGAEAQDRERFSQAMVEATTEYDWDELPNYLKDIFRNAAREFNHWADNEHTPLVGELANEIEAP